MWRLSDGFFFTATRDHSVLPVRLSKQITRHSCTDRSEAAVPAPYKPGLKVGSAMLLTAVVRNNRSPAMIGEECAKPGTATLNRTPCPFGTSHWAGKFCPSATPDACGPRKEGQSLACRPAAKTTPASQRIMLENLLHHPRGVSVRQAFLEAVAVEGEFFVIHTE